MATEDLELEPFTNDPELDFNFDEDMVGGINQEVNDGKTRSPVMDALVGQQVAQLLSSRNPTFT